MKKFVMILTLVLVAGTALFAQTPARSWYVSIKGNDDDNNGRSPEQAFRTFEKAFNSATSSNVKTITVVGQMRESGYGQHFYLHQGTGTAEILLTGQDENALIDLVELALNYGEKAPPSMLRIESLRIIGGFKIEGNVSLTLGKDAVFERGFKAQGKDLSVTMEANATARQREVEIQYGALLMKDNALISGAGIRVDGSGSTASFTMQDNATVEGGGVSVFDCDFSMLDKASITGAKDTGLTVAGSSNVTLQDNASITNCGRTTSSSTEWSEERPLQGGGIRIIGRESVVTLMGNTVISGNKARWGGGVYFESDGTDPQGYYRPPAGKGPPKNQRISARYRGYITSLIIQDKVQITGNEAREGGGIYAVRGSAAITITFTTDNDGRVPKTSPALTAPAITGVVMNGGTVSGNKADYGAGVYAAEALEVEYLQYTQPSSSLSIFMEDLSNYIKPTGRKSPVPAFTLNGGSVTGNEAQFVGGGVYAKVKGAYKAGRGTLSGNTAGDGEGEDLYTP